MKQRHVSHDSDEKPPKAKAKASIKKQKVQLPDISSQSHLRLRNLLKRMMGNIQQLRVRKIQRIVPLPTTTPPSLTPSPTVPDDEADFDCDKPQSGSQDTIPYHDPEAETEEPVLMKKT